MEAEQTQELWQVEAGGQVYETSFAEMTQWIEEGSLLRIDRVRRGNLRWIEAGKVPALISFFNAKDDSAPTVPIVTTSIGSAHFSAASTSNLIERPFGDVSPPPYELPAIDTSKCVVHPDAPARFFCDTCSNSFCKACPNSYGGNVKICPMCGALCHPIATAEKSEASNVLGPAFVGGRLGIDDVLNAFRHPFRFKISLVFGALMYSLVSLGQSATDFGGMLMLFSAIMCFMVANMFTFGILANVSENFAAGRLDDNFMPSFEDFNLWDDVVEPFLLSLGAYVVSFGPLIALVIVAFFFLLAPATAEMNGLQSDAARSVDPTLPLAANSVKRSQAVRELLDKATAAQQKRVAGLEESSIAAENGNPAVAPVAETDEEDFESINGLIQQSRKEQLESAMGKTPETIHAERSGLIGKIVGYGLGFLLIGGICLLWGIFYFPAACTVAGYTRSIAATLNPLVGLDSIRRLGLDYVKLLLVVVTLGAISAICGGFFRSVFSAFDLPSVGNLPASFMGSIVGFYLWSVFSCVVGLMLYKASDRLQLPT